VNAPILVTGASGHVGGAVARRLVAHGRPVRLLSRTPEKLAPLPGAHVVAGGYDDADALHHAIDGVAAAFVVSLPEGEERVAKHERVLRVAADAGVEHVVYLSFLGAGPDSAFPQGRWHHETETAMRRLLPGRWTAVRTGLYARALISTAGVVADGVLRAPAGTGRIAPVDHRDLAPVIARLLLDGSHRETAIDITGPALLDWPSIAAALGLPFADADPSWFATELRRQGTPDHLVEGMSGLFADVRAQRLSVVTDAIADLGGVLPHTLDESRAGGGPAGGRHLVRSFVAALDAHDVPGATDLVDPAYVQHNAAVAPGRDGLRVATEGFLAAAPDLVVDLVSTVDTGDHVTAAIRWTTRGTSWTSHDLWRHDGERFLEHWDDVDMEVLGRRLRGR
jgi:uncharacterized protein YbjT (DUF2867 family)/predicted SnoaL-like aldol condensation-catalyzing enzyme